MIDLTGKTAIVTGSAPGIGHATAEVLSKQGAAVVTADINGTGAEETAAAIRAADNRAITVQVDVEHEEQSANRVQVALDEYGRVDILHNAAALPVPDVNGRRFNELFERRNHEGMDS